MIRRLINMLDAIENDVQTARNDQQLGVRTGASSFLETATVVQFSQSSVTVTWRGSTVQARLATDEQLNANQQVWVLEADNGDLLVLGLVK